MTIETPSLDLAKLFSTDVTNTSFPSLIPTITEPRSSATRGVIEMVSSGNVSKNLLCLIPVGTGANNAVITGMRVTGWNRLRATPPLHPLWIPTPLLAVDMVFGNVTGVALSPLAATYFFMDTITLITNFGTANVSNEFLSNQGDLVGAIHLDAKGYQKVEVSVDLGANATGFNCLYRKW